MANQGVTYEIKAHDKASNTFKKVEVQSDKTKKSIDGLNHSTRDGADQATSAWSKTNNMLRGTVVIGGAIVSLRFGYHVAKDAVMAAAQLEKYNVTLKTMLGSTTAARDRMEEYLDVAKKTPYELYQVVEAGNQLEAIGRYSRENLEMLGDLAAASGKPMEQVMNAYAKLATNQKGEAINMFRDLLISDDDWIKATGKVKSTTEQMIKALPKIMKEKGFFGMMASQAETTEGKLSNAKDAVFSLSASLGERLKPSVDKGISAFTKWVEITEDWVKIPTAQKIAEEKFELNMLVNRLIDVNTQGEARKNIINELQRKYPEFLKNIDIEKANVNDLTKALSSANDEYTKKIRLAIYSAKIEKLQEKYKDVSENVEDALISVEAKKEVEKLSKEQDAIFNKYNANWQQSGSDNKGIYVDSYSNNTKKRTYLSKEDSERILVIREDMKASQSYVNKGGGWWNIDSYVIDKNTKAANEYKKQIDALMRLSGLDKENGDLPEPAEAGSATSGNKIAESDIIGGITGSSGKGSDLGTGRGGSGTGRNVTTTIQNLINGDIIIHTTNVTESAEQIKRIVIEALVDATNEIN